MTLDEAIKHAEEMAKEQDKLCKRYDDASGYTRSHNEDIRNTNAKRCEECAKEHRQLAEWLRELKQLREQSRWIPVSERLPGYGEEVLSFTKHENFKVAFRDVLTEPLWSTGLGKPLEVVAWMLLPKPYVVESKE